MTFAEELVGVILRVQELRARIESSQDKSITWFEELELIDLKARLERMQRAIDKNQKRRQRCVF